MEKTRKVICATALLGNCQTQGCKHRKPHATHIDCSTHTLTHWRADWSKPRILAEDGHMQIPLPDLNFAPEVMIQCHRGCVGIVTPLRLAKYYKKPTRKMHICPKADHRCVNICRHGVPHFKSKWCSGKHLKLGRSNMTCKPYVNPAWKGWKKQDATIARGLLIDEDPNEELCHARIRLDATD